MTLEELMREWNALPPQARQQVADFIAFLRERYGAPETEGGQRPGDLKDEPFVGMWRDRPDLVDSNEWVRTLRQEARSD